MADLPIGSDGPGNPPPLAKPVLDPVERAKIRLAFEEDFRAALAELKAKALPELSGVADPTFVAPDPVVVFRALAKAIDRHENAILAAQTQFRADVSFINGALLQMFGK